MKSRTWLTSYLCVDQHYESYVRARDKASALERLALRSLDERLESGPLGKGIDKRIRALGLYQQREFAQCVHWLCFAGNVLCNAHIWRRKDLLGDAGLIHRVVHEMTISEAIKCQYARWIEKERRATVRMLKRFDRQAVKVGL